MRLSAAEKAEIIRIVKRSELGVNQTLRRLGIHNGHSIIGTPAGARVTSKALSLSVLPEDNGSLRRLRMINISTKLFRVPGGTGRRILPTLGLSAGGDTIYPPFWMITAVILCIGSSVKTWNELMFRGVWIRR